MLFYSVLSSSVSLPSSLSIPHLTTLHTWHPPFGLEQLFVQASITTLTMSIANTNIAQTETSDLNDESVAGQSDTTIQYGPEHSNMTAVHDVDPFGAAFKARSLVKKCSLETSDGTLRLSRAIAASDRLMDHWNTKSGASACIEKLRNDDSPWGAELRKRQSTFYQEVNGISIDLINARNTTDEKGSTDLAQADRLIFGCKVSLDNSVPLERL